MKTLGGLGGHFKGSIANESIFWVLPLKSQMVLMLFRNGMVKALSALMELFLDSIFLMRSELCFLALQ